MVKYFNEYTNVDFKCDKYPDLKLDIFQLAAIEAIHNGAHPLVTAHTGSGKTLPAEYAIQYYVCELKKKVIYTAPIKSLSNQKFNEFKQKMPYISFGILTGDIKFNPDAECIIMTTEILRNSLSLLNGEKGYNNDLINDIGCVIFDEVHYINDTSRGKVWEECIMWLPKKITMVMLSATIDKVNQFAEWIEKIKGREVWVCSTGKRVVPLIHYSFLSINDCSLKMFDSDDKKRIKTFIDGNLHILKDSNNTYSERNINELYSIIKLTKNVLDVKRSTVIHRIVENLKNNDMLPAICFVFSRQRADDMAKQLNINLIDTDPTTIEREIQNILKNIDNSSDYIETNEYKTMIELMKRGIAVHHSGVIPVIREIVEMMFAKGYIKVLFATETFAVGVNMPTKTVMFTDIQKFSDGTFRYLHPHEYTQMSGRAGRRGLDNVGHVIHLFNLYNDLSMISPVVLKNILNGSPQTLKSKYNIWYDTILHIMNSDSNNICKDTYESVMTSMIQYEVNGQIREIDKEIHTTTVEIEKIRKFVDENKYIIQYYDMLNEYKTTNNKKKSKKIYEEMKQFSEEIYKKYRIDVVKKVNILNEIDLLESKLLKLNEDKVNAQEYLMREIEEKYNYLCINGFYDSNNRLSLLGKVSLCFKEVNCIIFSKLIIEHSDIFKEMSAPQLVGALSIFVIDENNDCLLNNINDEKISKLVDIVMNYDNEITLCFDKIEYFINWCISENDIDCKRVIADSGLYAGEFIKAILKINNICEELNNACELTNNMFLKSLLCEIPKLTLKSIATNKSLYL